MDNHTAFNNTSWFGYTCQQVEDAVNNYSGSLMKYTIMTTFGLIAGFGFIGNLFVIFVVLRNKAMRTPRSYFIVNLATSDLMLCFITMPITVYGSLSKVWSIGLFWCKSITMLQAVNIFVSTMSITAIGLDRYLVFVPPRLRKVVTITFCALVWGLSIVLAFPLVNFTTYQSVSFPFTDLFLRCGFGIHYCYEPLDMNIHENRAYTVGRFLFQYCLPLFTLAFIYSKAFGQLKPRISFRKRANAGYQKGKTERELQRQHGSDVLVVLIIVIFVIAWLPFNVKNIIESFSGQTEIKYKTAITVASCCATAMISACANPVLYGILNVNFRYEFAKLLQLARCCPDRMNRIKLDVNNVTRSVEAMTGKGSKETASCVSLDIIEDTVTDPKLCKLVGKQVASDTDQDEVE